MPREHPPVHRLRTSYLESQKPRRDNPDDITGVIQVIKVQSVINNLIFMCVCISGSIGTCAGKSYTLVAAQEMGL